MTIAATSRMDYVGSNTLATYAFTYPIVAAADLLVTKRDTSGVETTLALNTDYTVAGVGVATGGSITLLAGNLPTSYALTIRRVVSLAQAVDIRNQSGFFPDVLENEFDKLASADQQEQDGIDRALRVAETDPAITRLPAVAQRLGKFLAFDAGGNPTVSAGSGGGDTSLRTDLAASGGSALAGFLQAGTSAVAQTAQAKLRETRSVRDYGAVAGSGNATANTAAFRAALAATLAAGGGRLWVNPGYDFYQNDFLTIGAGVTLCGDPFWGSTLTRTGTGFPMLSVGGNDAGVVGLRLIGPGGTASLSDHGISAVGARITIEDCTIRDMAGIGITTALTYSHLRHNHISGCNGNGINLSGGSGYNDVDDNELHDNLYAGVGCNGSYNDIHDNHLYANGGGASDVQDWSGIVIHYAGAGTFTADHNHVHDNFSHDNKGSGIQVSGTSQTGVGAGPFSPYGNVIEDNHCWGHTQTPGGWLQWPAGIAIHHAGTGTKVSGNFCFGNYFNYSFAGWGGYDGQDLSVVDNTSIAAVNDGFYFTDDPWNTASGGPQQGVVITGNVSALDGRDGMRFDNLRTFTMSGYQIHGNKVRSAGAYSYRVIASGYFTNYVFFNNTSVTPGTGDTLNLVVTLTGVPLTFRVALAEDATHTSHVATVPIPAGSTLHDIQVDQRVLWGAAAAVLKVGDTANDAGYFTGVNLKATDLLVAEQLRISVSELWGGRQGAYLVAATGQRGPQANNFGGYYAQGSNILATVTVTTPGSTAGRTYLTVTFSIGTPITPVVS